MKNGIPKPELIEVQDTIPPETFLHQGVFYQTIQHSQDFYLYIDLEMGVPKDFAPTTLVQPIKLKFVLDEE